MENAVIESVDDRRKEKTASYIVGIGSSAGGLKALEEFFGNCPIDSGLAFVVVQHLSPNHKSLMPELLSRHTEMPVKEVKEGDLVLPNHVYMIPGIKNIQIKDKKLVLTDRPSGKQVNFSIDIFFNSLALEQKEKALAIILSGTGSDGTKGSMAIKEEGGTVFVQSSDSSTFDGMPRSVISHGLADYVLNPKEMGKELLELVSYFSDPSSVSLINHQDATEFLKQILNIIETELFYDFSFYKKPTLFRRTAKRVGITKSQTLENYINYLNDNPEEKQLLVQEYLIGVTNFFRDAKAFEIIEKEVIPSIFRNKKNELLKIWIVACSTGEEAYSICILIEEYMQKMKIDIEYKIFATDLNDKAISIAAKGIYDQNIESEVPFSILNKYFVNKDIGYQIVSGIRKNIIFSKHDVLRNPPFSRMDLVSCRNMLIYMENNIKNKALSNIHYSLNLNGYLFLGKSENLGELNKKFHEVNGKWKIYKNIQADRAISTITKNSWNLGNNSHKELRKQTQHENLNINIIRTSNKILLENYGAVCVCIDENCEIVQAFGKLKQYIQYPEEGYSNNLLKIFPDELGVPISTVTQKQWVDSEEIIEKKVKLFFNNIFKELRLLISFLGGGNKGSIYSRFFLVTIIEDIHVTLSEQEKKTIQPTFSSNDGYLQELKEVLRETRENLQSTIEELETSNEEMQATNEELLASNEELQSTNEELQSLNEELHTVNAELHQKNVQLVELNSDVENLMKNINIGTIFLDKEFRIRKFTPAIQEHYHLRQEDIERSISHFSGTVSGIDLITYSEEVIKTLQVYREEVANNRGVWFLMQIFPYRSEKDVIEGVVINFLNINELKLAINEKEQLNGFLSHLTDANPAIIYIYDLINKQNVYSSSGIGKIAGYTAEEIKKMGAQLFEIITFPDDIKRIDEHHKKLKDIADGEILQIEYRLIHKNRKKVIWLLSSDKVNERAENGQVKTILGVTQVITESKTLELKLKESEERFRLAVTATRSGLWEWSDLTMDKAWFSKEFCRLLGYNSKEMKSSFRSLVNLIHPDQLYIFKVGLESHLKSDVPFEEEIQIKTNKKGYQWFRINGHMQRNGAIRTTKKVVGTLLDIDHRKKSEYKMQELNVDLERFAYLASHDLKEPLRTVTSFTKLFKEEYKDKFDENAMQYLDFIERASSRMITLTNDLLVHSQLDDKSLKFELVDLNQIISNIKDDLQSLIQENEAVIKVEQLPTIICDTVQIRQLFQNLMSNSLKYRKEGEIPVIDIQCRKKRDSFEFCVKDNGIGIPEKNYTEIFEVFKRLHGQSEYEGTGIGLANCKRIVDNHQGKIWVESVEGKGSDFFFVIPKLSGYEKN